MQNINGKTKLYGLIANPVEHTKSPLIHNGISDLLGINSVYLPFLVKDSLEEAINGAKALNIQGLNVTIPYKQDVIKYLDEIDQEAKEIGAVNTIIIKNDKLIGYNTDARGLARDCKRQGVSFDNKNVCILGAGGAANAVAILCAKSNVNKLYIVNRTMSKAETLRDMIRMYYKSLDITCLSYDDIYKIDDIDICVQTTSLGMSPYIDRSPIDNNEFFEKLEVVVDIVYNPRQTKFLKDAAKHGVMIINGLGMLYYQAVEAYEIWNDIVISDQDIEIGYLALQDNVYSCN